MPAAASNPAKTLKQVNPLSGRYLSEKNPMKTRQFTIVIHQEDDQYIAQCPEVGTVDQGETIEAAVAGLKEATRLYLEEFPLL